MVLVNVLTKKKVSSQLRCKEKVYMDDNLAVLCIYLLQLRSKYDMKLNNKIIWHSMHTVKKHTNVTNNAKKGLRTNAVSVAPD